MMPAGNERINSPVNFAWQLHRQGQTNVAKSAQFKFTHQMAIEAAKHLVHKDLLECQVCQNVV